jgi:hypothetical protein
MGPPVTSLCENARTDLTQSEILSHAIETIDRRHLGAVADVLSRLRLPERDLERVHQLLERNRLRTIMPVERTILDKYLRVGNSDAP